jgi:hypothetical protein
MEQISTDFNNTNSSAPPISHPFETAWTPSKRSALDTATFQISKPAPRAWQRTPHSPVALESRFKKVWKRYELRSLNYDDSGSQASARSPGRAVKKLRINSPKPAPVEIRAMRNARQSSSTRFVATKWDRRRSVHHRRLSQFKRVVSPTIDSSSRKETKRVENVSYEGSCVEQSSTSRTSGRRQP